MRPGTIDEKTTLPEPSDVPAVAAGCAPSLALTILFHPLVHRVGERAILGPLAAQTRGLLARNQPELAPPQSGGGAAGGAPLDDPHVSRTPLTITATSAGAVQIDATATSTSVVVKGRPISLAAFSPDEVRRGVVLLLASRVVLLLHVVAPAPWPLRGDDLGLFGESDGLRHVLAQVKAVADLPRPVLLRGEGGSGKELVASAVHRVSPRRAAPFIAVNLGALPATLAAAELFGSERGAFTGAVRRRGLFEQAEGGTLFLDEIGEAPVEVQAALLRALQDGEIQPVGADRPRKVDVRIVAATDADLEARIAEGSFRAPLHSRLAAYQIWIPALRERRDDIGRLLVRFCREELREIGEPEKLESAPGGAPWLPAQLVARLAEHAWPGNIRQLRNVVRHLVVGSRGQERVTMTDAAARLLSGSPAREGDPESVPVSGAPPSARSPAPSDRPLAPSRERPRDGEVPSAASRTGGVSPSEPPRAGRPAAARGRKAAEIPEAEIVAALEATDFEIAAAARRLGIPRPSLHLAMKRLGLRTAGDLPVADIERAFEASSGDLTRMARELRVSERALLRRTRELGLAPDSTGRVGET